MRRCDSLPPLPPHFVAFAWRYHSVRLSSSLPTRPDAGRRPGALGSGSPTPVGCRGGDGRVSQVPGEPPCAFALFSDPGGTDAPGPTVRRHGPRYAKGEGYPRLSNISGLNGTASALRCLRFAGWVTPPPRKTRFRLLAWLSRTGLSTRRVPTKGFQDAYISSSFPKLFLAQLQSLQGLHVVAFHSPTVQCNESPRAGRCSRCRDCMSMHCIRPPCNHCNEHPRRHVAPPGSDQTAGPEWRGRVARRGQALRKVAKVRDFRAPTLCATRLAKSGTRAANETAALPLACFPARARENLIQGRDFVQGLSGWQSFWSRDAAGREV